MVVLQTEDLLDILLQYNVKAIFLGNVSEKYPDEPAMLIFLFLMIGLKLNLLTSISFLVLITFFVYSGFLVLLHGE